MIAGEEVGARDGKLHCLYYNSEINEELLKKCIEAHIPGRGCARCRYYDADLDKPSGVMSIGLRKVSS